MRTLWTRGDLARAAGRSPDAALLWARRGRVHPYARTPGGIELYDPEAADVQRAIADARARDARRQRTPAA
jgi:hypothetical protein